jgi:Na+-translocating ferredoxin:NAD+ oxidoreductase RnfG subunit
MLGAFFMATDYSTSPITESGQYIFGALLGILTWLFRLFGNGSEGVSYAIIFRKLSGTADRALHPSYGIRYQEGKKGGSEGMKKQTSVVHDTIIITIITLVAGVLLGLVYGITKEPIAEQEKATRMKMEQAVFSNAASFSVLDTADQDAIAAALTEAGLDRTTVNSIDEASDNDGSLLGYVVDVTNSEGYGGDVEILVGISTGAGSKTINGISFLTLNETAGLGQQAKEDAFSGHSGSERRRADSITKQGIFRQTKLMRSRATIQQNARYEGCQCGSGRRDCVEGGAS